MYRCVQPGMKRNSRGDGDHIKKRSSGAHAHESLRCKHSSLTHTGTIRAVLEILATKREPDSLRDLEKQRKLEDKTN
ncbi:Hypothetical predicted protein [Xyrichtys novacula]|uniref:Uncharacterized protein n=1 Tax=Xyrichtys novacula TaxID=13765 RepID=A0AAV1H2L6_XYRNO|nr:Hypothetical predicted protein [Xyrichtys novacula]